jgi:hypothetical protein
LWERGGPQGARKRRLAQKCFVLEATALPCRHWRGDRAQTKEATVAKGQQRSNKETKKPKKDAKPKPVQGGNAQPITTAVIERGKKTK